MRVHPTRLRPARPLGLLPRTDRRPRVVRAGPEKERIPISKQPVATWLYPDGNPPKALEDFTLVKELLERRIGPQWRFLRHLMVYPLADEESGQPVEQVTSDQQSR